MRRGFSVVENLVVITIIVILSLAVFPSYFSAKQSLALQRSASKLAQDIRDIQEMTMSSQVYSDCIGTTGYKYGYGISLRQGEAFKYKLFADCNGNEAYDLGTDKIVREIDFEKEVEIQSLSSSNLDIIFTPAEPTVTIVPTMDTAVITLINKRDITKNVIINKIGLIDID